MIKILEKIKELWDNILLKNSERKWELYDDLPEFDIDWLYAYIDQLQTGGHFNSQINWSFSKTVNNSIVVVNLNKRVTEDSIISTLNHEALHVAICNCLKNQSNDFIEKIIEKLLGERLVCNGWEGQLQVQKI